MKHKHATYIHAWADGEEVEYLLDCDGRDEWVGIGTSHVWSELNQYRFKPRMIKCGSMEFPEPMRVAPDVGTMYWVTSTCTRDFCYGYPWEGDGQDKFNLDRGMAHLTQAAAAAHARALISLTEVRE